jgi:hypothetical protein
LQSLAGTTSENHTTYDWIRPSLIATSKKTSIAGVTSAPRSVRDLQILERVPISSDFIKRETIHNLRSLSQQPSNQRNTIEENNLTVSGDEIFSFKGPLIDKDGKLYIDEEYDQTYQKRLRVSEVNAIQEYIQANTRE